MVMIEDLKPTSCSIFLFWTDFRILLWIVDHHYVDINLIEISIVFVSWILAANFFIPLEFYNRGY